MGAFGLDLQQQLLAADNPNSEVKGRVLTAKDVNDHLRSLCEVREPSVDRIIIGMAETPVSKIGTVWTPYWKTCREAVSRGINTLVVHEPTFYTHWDLDGKDKEVFRADVPGGREYRRVRDEKIRWINENGLVIIRCHDVLDKVAGFGIPFGLGRALGFSDADIIRSRDYYNVYRIEPAPAAEVGRRVARALKTVGQPGLAFYGDGDRKVGSVGVGTGCICDPIQFMDLEPDLFIAIDDAVRTWTQTTYAEDTGRPLIVINHGTSEEFGVRLLSRELKEAFPDKDVIHLEQGCSYKWIPA
jgi:putative NIF3 family GTP cyclohydrolase 1 type 2